MRLNLMSLLFSCSIAILILSCKKTTKDHTQIEDATNIFQRTGNFNAENSCLEYPTQYAEIDERISTLVASIDSFDRRFMFFYNALSSSDKAELERLIEDENIELLSSYPEFDDADLKTLNTNIKLEYAQVLSTYEDYFPEISESEIIDEAEAAIKCAYISLELETEPNMFGICEDIRINCIASVAATAAAMHVACIPADASFFGGLICHGAAIVYQATAGRNCNLAYEQCIK